MNWLSTFLIGFICAGPILAATPSGFPFSDEDLTYSINWPSGLSLGDAHMIAKGTAKAWSFEFNLDAGVPGFQVKDSYQSDSTTGFCSVAFTRTESHGGRKTQEKETIDGSNAKRETLNGGGESRIPVPDCVKDALDFLYFTRRELGQGRVPPGQQILFGGLYQVQLEYAGAQTIPIGEVPTESDKILCTIKGPAGGIKFEMYFARDVARTPLLFKAPLAMGLFSMELVR